MNFPLLLYQLYKNKSSDNTQITNQVNKQVIRQAGKQLNYQLTEDMLNNSLIKDNQLTKNTNELTNKHVINQLIDNQLSNRLDNQPTSSLAESRYHLTKKSDSTIKPNLTYQKGIRCRWILPGDILWFFSTKKTLKNIKEFLKFREKDKNIQLHYDVFSKDDPLPVLGFFLAALRYSLSKKMWGFVVRKV